MLMLWSFHTVYVAADWMVMPRCLSNSMESIVAPTPSFPFTYITQERESIREPHLNGKKELDEDDETDSPHGSLLSCRCSRARARSGWFSRSRCERRSRCCGSSRLETHRRSSSGSCWWAPEDMKPSEFTRSIYRLLNKLDWGQVSRLGLDNITFLSVTLPRAERCVLAKNMPAFNTLISATAQWSTAWS